MTHVRIGTVAAILLLMLAPGAFAALGATTSAEACYLIPTHDSLVRILVGAYEVGDGLLISDLTTGERWVLGTFFGLEPQLLIGEEVRRCDVVF